MDGDGGAIFFKAPSLSIGNHAMMYLYTPLLRFLPLKNFLLTDSTVILNGPELGIYAGILSIWYSSQTGFDLRYGGGIDYKSPLWEKSWLSAECGGSFDLYRHWRSWLEAGLGRQLTPYWAIKVSLAPKLNEYVVYYTDLDIEKSYLGYSINVPVELIASSGRHFRTSFRTGFAYINNTFNRIPFYGALIGFHFIWHW